MSKMVQSGDPSVSAAKNRNRCSVCPTIGHSLKSLVTVAAAEARETGVANAIGCQELEIGRVTELAI